MKGVKVMENKVEWKSIFEFENEEANAFRNTAKMKVNGGEIYVDYFRLDSQITSSMVFVPDVDLQRYQAHLRDAYKKGYEDGQVDHARNIDVYQEGYEQGVSDALEVVKTDAPPSTS